ncbi:site-specific integrase [Actinoallomurus sp. NBC_01490]|jgi:integrase|uniref:tyrosine-type recombinase/integrase n=1 Tax=Actinoallomurus sp. NBC_01490 TaxID=2903557 RepID=UPI002E32058A|nr:site-specific integrase [Actinoallomurus sp. NBC_01490]
MAKGRTFKRCGCRTTDGARLGGNCPKLKRRNGWNPHHGTWHYQLELPPTSDGKRRAPLRRGGFTDQTAAQADMDAARELLALAGEDKALAVRIADIITTTVKDTGKLPQTSEIRRRVRTGQELDQQRTVTDWLNTWLAGKQQLRDSSTAAYASHIRLYFNPVIGHIRLDRLQVSHVLEVFEAIDELNDTIETARQTGDPAIRAKVKGRRPVGPATKHRIRATLRSALNTAIKQRLIDFNPAAVIELPPARRPKALVWTDERIDEWRQARQAYVEEIRRRKQILAARSPHGAKLGTAVTALDSYIGTPRPSPVMVWTPKQTQRFLDRAEHHRLYALFHLVAFRGLRRGEACGLRRPELDVMNRVATVRWQIVQIGATTTQGPPKSDAGDRQIALDRRTVNVLLVHQARQNNERLAAGEHWADTGFVFTTQTGQPLHPAEVTEQFHWLCMEADLPPIRLHDLRHGAATLLLAAGHDMKMVQETLGLSSITIAADTYTSVLPELARQAAEDVAALLPPAPGRRAIGHGRKVSP